VRRDNMAIKMYTIGKHVIVTDDKTRIVFSKDINRKDELPLTIINKSNKPNKVLKLK